MSGHKQRAHSKFSASGSERWLNCAASVELEERSPESKDSEASKEGTKAHEHLEVLFKIWIYSAFAFLRSLVLKSTEPMVVNGLRMVKIVLEEKARLVEAELLVEVRVHNNEIHSEMFGTVDAALVELFGTLHVFDYKYGTGHIVSPEKNTQMIQYALGLAERYDWNFTDVVLHIVQPRGGGNGHKEWRLTIDELRSYREIWRKGVARVEKGGNKPFVGNWCFWCRARQIDPATGMATCPAKREATEDKVVNRFLETPINERTENGLKEKSQNKKGGKTAEEKELEAWYKKRERQNRKKENAFQKESFF